MAEIVFTTQYNSVINEITCANGTVYQDREPIPYPGLIFSLITSYSGGSKIYVVAEVGPPNPQGLPKSFVAYPVAHTVQHENMWTNHIHDVKMNDTASGGTARILVDQPRNFKLLRRSQKHCRYLNDSLSYLDWGSARDAHMECR